MLFFASAFCGGHPKIFLQSSKHIEVLYYSPSHEYLVTHLIRSYENALNFELNLFHFTPSQKLTVLLEDFGDYGHGAAGTVPSNFIDVGIAPFSYTYETLPANERMTWIMNHESIHIVMGDNSNSADRRYRSLFFGKVMPTDDDPISIFYSSLTSPRHYATRWFHEGIATFMETWMAGGLGRAMGGWDEMVFRTMVHDDAYIYDVVGLESEGTSSDFQSGANSYLYGTRFMNYLARQYGPEKLLGWITRTDDSRAYFESQFQRVYGVSLSQEWRRWIVGNSSAPQSPSGIRRRRARALGGYVRAHGHRDLLLHHRIHGDDASRRHHRAVGGQSDTSARPGTLIPGLLPAFRNRCTGRNMPT